MDTWFEVAHERFSLYLEEKLEWYGASLVHLEASAHDDGANATGGQGSTAAHRGISTAAVLDSGLRTLPDCFLDAAHEFMERTYYGLDNGYDVTEDTAASGGGGGGSGGDDDDGGNTFLYGELTPVGVRQLLGMPEVSAALELPTNVAAATKDYTTASCSSAAPNDCCRAFVDLGSGTGKLVFEAACILNTQLGPSGGTDGVTQLDAAPSPTPAAAAGGDVPTGVPAHGVVGPRRAALCIGIELSHTRHSIAIAAVERSNNFDDGVRGGAIVDPARASTKPSPASGEEGFAVCRRIVSDVGCLRLIEGNFFDTFPGEERVAVAFACALGFGATLTNALCERVVDLWRAHGTLKCAVLLVRDVPGVAATMLSRGAVTVRRVALHTTWMNEAPALVVLF